MFMEKCMKALRGKQHFLIFGRIILKFFFFLFSCVKTGKTLQISKKYIYIWRNQNSSARNHDCAGLIIHWEKEKKPLKNILKKKKFYLFSRIKKEKKKKTKHFHGWTKTKSPIFINEKLRKWSTKKGLQWKCNHLSLF